MGSGLGHKHKDLLSGGSSDCSPTVSKSLEQGRGNAKVVMSPSCLYMGKGVSLALLPMK